MEDKKIPDAAMGSLLQNLKDFIQYNADLIVGLNKISKKLYDDLDLFNSFINKYSTEIHTDNNNHILEKLVDDVRKVVHEAEDVFEEYIICRTLHKDTNIGEQGSHHLLGYVPDLRNVLKQIEEVSAKVTIFYQKDGPIGLEALKIEEATNKSEKKKTETHVVEEDNVVGFEDEARKVIELLTDESEPLEIVSIIGMLGQGKTTLAKKVFNDPKIENKFQFRVFVNVCREYERKKIFIDILLAITPHLYSMQEDKIIEVLHKLLERRKYLIVMDGVLTPEVWIDLRVAFPKNNNRSRILITSRDKQVATCASPLKWIHNLSFMTRDESRELLRRNVFMENACPLELQGYELHILNKCDGLPLAIVVVASILLNHRDRIDWWEKVAESMNDCVARDQSQSNDLIKSSFNHLPYHLKACFLYLGVFPEDFEIPAWKLLRLWIAEGFIHMDGNMGTLEDIAADYLEELVDRNLVIVVKRKSNGQIKTCRVYDILRDFCKKEASKQNLFQLIEKFDQATFLFEHPALQSYRRICINSSVNNYVTSKPFGIHVRSFLTFSKEKTPLLLDQIALIPEAFRLLRVLDAKSIVFTSFPDELLYLFLLKYIAISSKFRVIPEEFSNLRNLQTVVVDTAFGCMEIKADIWKFTLLRHLKINGCVSLPESEEPSTVNTNLQTLSCISTENCSAEVFERCPNLKKLGIYGKLYDVIAVNGDSALFETSLVKLELLENLKLMNENPFWGIDVLPHETYFPRNLKKLTLLYTLLEWRHISTLGKLQKLEVLKLEDYAFDGNLWDTEDGGFRCLKVLHIGCTNIKTWKANASHFPILTSLYVRSCNFLEAIPLGIADILTLQTIDIYCCKETSVALSAQKIQIQKQKKNKTAGQFKLVVYPPYQ